MATEISDRVRAIAETRDLSEFNPCWKIASPTNRERSVRLSEFGRTL